MHNEETQLLVDRLSNDNINLSDEQQLSTQVSSIWDVTYKDDLDYAKLDNVLMKQPKQKLNPLPYIKCGDLNNSKDFPYENKPVHAIEIGLKFSF